MSFSPMRLLTGLPGPSGAQTLAGDIGLLVLRLWAGGIMALVYGIGKLERLGQDPIEFADPLGIGPTMSLVGTVLTELVGGLMVAFGLLTRAALAGLIFTFIIVVFVVKIGEGFNGMALGFAFLIMYIVLALTGPGRLSLDYLITSRSKTLADAPAASDQAAS